MKSTKGQTKSVKPVSGLVSKYVVECTACGKHWRDQRRDSLIEAELKKNPDYLKTYVCRTCKRIAKTQKFEAFKSQFTPEPEVTATTPVQAQEIKVEDVKVDNFTAENLKKYIPPPSSKYVNRSFSGVKDIDVLKFHYESKDPLLKNVLFIGETGTGKSLLVSHFCNINKIPYHRVVMNAGTTTEDIIGQWVMDKDGKMNFNYQVLINFMKYGGVFVFDEINAGQKEMLHILNSITDFARQVAVTQHKGEVIEACDKFLVVACMNPPQEYDLQEMSKSLKSRFIPYYFDYDEKVDKQVLGKDEKALLEFTKTIRLARINGEIDTPLSTRDLVQFKLMRDSLGYNLAKEVLINKFHNGEKNAVRTQMEVLLETSTILDKKEGEKNEQ